jgi:predicted lipoprotein with Yx(FWY)xxD motif
MQVTMRAGRATVALVVMAAVFAACSNAGTATTVPATAGPTTASVGLTLQVRQDATLGGFVTGKDGLSLYVFTNDTSGKSTCVGDCATNWPPLTVPSAAAVIAGSGVTGALGTITRDDGALQVTLGGAPLYYFVGDSAAGQTNGQGLLKKWYVASPTGTAMGAGGGATTAPATQAPAGTTAPGGSKCSGPACY